MHVSDTSLWLACLTGDVASIRAIVGNADILNHIAEIGTFRGKRRRTPLGAACDGGHVDAVRLILEMKADLSQEMTLSGGTALYIASQMGHCEVVEVLLANRANANETCDAGGGPLFIASQEGHYDVVEVLLANRANVDHIDDDGFAPLFIASQEGHCEVVEVLLANRANADETCDDGFTPLFTASQEGHHDVVEVLLANRANVHQADDGGFTPLLLASHTGHCEVVEVLLANRANVNQANDAGVTALLSASQKGHDEVVEVLLANRANVDQADAGGTAPLIASQEGRCEVVEMANGANVMRACDAGATALHCSAMRGHLKAMQGLLASGANLHTLLILVGILLFIGQNGNLVTITASGNILQFANKEVP